MIIKGSTVQTASFTVKMATIHTDSSQRDAQFDGRIMDVATYPDGTFALTRPIALAPLPATGTITTYTATGRLTLHRSPAGDLPAQDRADRGGSRSRALAGAVLAVGVQTLLHGFVTTQSHGIMEFLLDFRPAC